MITALEQFRLGIPCEWITPSSGSFQPPSWPPPRDWVVSEDKDGKVLSRWGDPIWDLSPLAKHSFTLNFGDGPLINAKPIDPENANYLRMLVTWRMFGPRPAQTTSALMFFFTPIRAIVALCSREGISVSKLMQFPKVFDQVPSVIAPSQYGNTIALLHRLFDSREILGFVVVTPDGLKRLAAARPNHDPVQTAYIPPRIWTYQVNRLRECLDDYLAHQEQIETCFCFCLDAYARNYGSLQAALTSKSQWSRIPFRNPPRASVRSQSGCFFHGPFQLTAERFGIHQFLQRWLDNCDKKIEVRNLSSYLTLIQYVGLAYITNFTLQRIEEASSLRQDCLIYEDDPKLGRIPIICGETTKIDLDSDARWPTSPSVQVAVDVLTSVACLRMRCAMEDPRVAPTHADIANPYLIDRAYEPWTGSHTANYTVRKNTGPYKELQQRFPKLFDPEQMRITEDDFKIARLLTPNLPEADFSTGSIWPLAWHQLRRTTAVNMFASGLLSDSSMQFLMKHISRLMPLYYGRGYTRLHLNEEVEGIVATSMYEVMAQSILAAMGDRFVSPYADRKQAIVVNLIGQKDAQDLAKLAKRGEIFFRENRLGACMKRGACEYGGVESVANCAGGNGKGPCADVLYDKTKVPAVIQELEILDSEIARLPINSPRQRALVAERKGLENYLNVVEN
ncbi:MAG: hypothetical protein LBE81_07620 [Azonexus sp.]|jgi:hypothetical protein|uniref:hypothetical protein n=1 Tax=Azonexus sp. TaxID=1872668 RepID=UPI00282B3C74|nr:hypothetical protein [Azonexus sp.]MDR0776490.1 hypothetical protein [Azonexus sp.]